MSTGRQSRFPPDLCDQTLDHRSTDIGQFPEPAGVQVGEAAVVETHEVQDSGVDIANRYRLLAPDSEFISLARGRTALHVASREPHDQSILVVVADSLARPTIRGASDCIRNASS